LTKRNELFAEAEKMYVIDQCNLEKIAEELALNSKTVIRWKQHGNWEEKRAEYIKSKQMFHEELYHFARKLMHSIEADIEKGEKTDSAKMYTFLRMLPSITKVKEYEEVMNKKQTLAEDKTSLTPEDVREIEELLGIKRIPKEE